MVDKRFYISDDYAKILPHFLEECGEAIAAGGKTLRWGLDSYNPLLPVEEQELNKDWLIREIKDVIETGQALLKILEE